MLELLYILLYGKRSHDHHWKHIDTINNKDVFDCIERTYVLQCSECGTIKVKKAGGS